MNIKERQAVYAFALVENAKSSLHLAGCVIGNLQYEKNKNIATDIHAAYKAVEEVRMRLDMILDDNTDWNDNLKIGETR